MSSIVSNPRLLFVACLIALGCGGAQTTESEPADDSHAEEHHDGHHGHHEGSSEPLRAFHDVLAPVYHMDAGPERAEAACAAVPQMTELAGGVDEAAGNGATADAVTNLAAACGAGAEVEAALEPVHDAFHAAMEAEHH